MGACDLEIVLDEPDRVFEQGDAITGRVIVTIDEEAQCDGLVVEQGWRTHGRGNTERSVLAADTLFSGTWEQAGRREYEFTFAQPPGPATFHGHFLNVDWFFRVTADIPWALDPDAEVDYLARFTGSRSDYQIGNFESVEKAGQPAPSCVGCLTVFGIGTLLVAVFPILMFTVEGHTEMLVVGLFFGAIGVAMMAVGLLRRAARKKLGHVEVTLEPPKVFRGEELCCTVEITPPSEVELNDISQKLTGTEVVTRGSGTNSRTYRHEVFSQTDVTDWGGPRTLKAADTAVFTGKFTIPQDAPPSFDSGDDNKLEWVVETVVDIPAWPDWSSRHYVVVVPVSADPAIEPEESPDEATNGADEWW